MKSLFENNEEKIHKYLKEAVINKEAELEVIFGETNKKNPITKEIFKKVLNECKTKYEVISEENSLDIRVEFKKDKQTFLSNIRATIKGIDDIKKYCKNEDIEMLSNVEYIQKSYYKNSNESFKFYPIKENDYNVRLNIKKETELEKTNYKVVNFNKDFKRKNKHFRYKKRFSFLTDDKLFRIDLSVIKSTLQKHEKYELNKSFRESNVLNNPETFELEIEYIGGSGENEVNQKEIKNLFNQLKENYVLPDPSNLQIGNIYDPLDLGINIKPDKKEETFEYLDSPRYTEPTTYNQSFEVSSIKYSKEDYLNLLGKYVRIKDEYFTENNVDIKINEVLKRYYEYGIHIGIVKEIYEELSIEDNSYVQTIVKINIYPEIGETSELFVPLKYIYSDIFEIHEDRIIEVFGKKTNLKINKPEDYVNLKIINAQTMKKLTDKLLKIIERNVFHLNKIIYNTNILIPFTLQDEIIDKYNYLTNKKPNFAENSGSKYKKKYFTFMGPQPVTLGHKNIKLKPNNSILVNYAVTEKADGERYELFITDKHGYLINNKGEIIDTDTIFNSIYGDWLIDGEYITKNKFNEPINLFVAFDVYWCGFLTPQPAYTYPFVSDDISRIQFLEDFNKSLKDIKYLTPTWAPNYKAMNFSIKEYRFGYTTNDTIEGNELDKIDIMKIFEASKQILDKDEKDEFIYRIDGLIYLPTNLPVKSDVDGVAPKNINGTWDQNFKWKPPEENTIDFMVKIKKKMINSILKEKKTPYNDGPILREYKTADLVVGYDVKRDDSINFCMDILLNKEISDDEKSVKLKKFSVEGYNETNIPLVNGKMICLNHSKDEIHDGDIVEMRFNPEAENNMFWEPLRVRSDKIKPQFFTIADNVWETIQNPITNKMILGGYKDFKSNVEELKDHGLYYINNNDDDLSESYPLRKLHNYIKTKLISSVCGSFNKKIKILDLSIGRGGDIRKYINKDFNVDLLLGLDISSNYKESCKRFYYEKKPKPKGIFLRADTSKSIKNGECSQIEDIDPEDKLHTENMLSIIYNRVSPIDKKYEDINKKYKGIAQSGFDVVSSQFSLHYYFKNQSTFQTFIQNLVDNVKVGGYFIGCCYNGNKIFDEFLKFKDLQKSSNPTSDDSDNTDSDDSDNTDDDEEDDKKNYNIINYTDTTGNLVYSIEKKYDLIDFNYNPEDISNMFGNEINVYMDSIGQIITEYLVNFKFFIKVMEEKGFELSSPKKVSKKHSLLLNSEFIEDKLGSFKKVIENLDEIKDKDNEFREFYSDAYNIKYNPLLKRLSSFNNYFIFERKN